MPTTMIHPITALTPELEAVLKEDTDRRLRNLIAANIKTRYARSSSQLSDFFLAVNDKDLQNDESVLSDFRRLVSPTEYESYPDMLAPGLPIYIPLSSATSGKKPKQFVKYFRSQPYSPNPSPFRVGTTSLIYSFAYRDPVEIVTDSGEVVKRIPLQRDIIHHRSFLLIHALFSLASTSLEEFATVFIANFMDMVHLIQEEWATLISSIRNGIPDFEQIDHVRPYLQDPLSCPGWAQRVWPKLKLLTNICSGTFATALPQPGEVNSWTNVIIHNPWYICSECLIGRTLNFGDTETFVVATDDLIEFLDMTTERMPGQVLQAWDLQPGKFYQPVATTHDGLWRYLIDDVIQVTGFDPRNGLPVFRYSGRKNLGLRLPHAMITEADLVNVIDALNGDDIMEVQEFTTVVDDRKFPHTVGFFISITGNMGPNAKSARQKAFAALVATSDEHQIAFDTDEFGLPTIRIVKPGTFTDYRRWRGETLNVGVGQIKLPSVLFDPKAQEWVAERVMLEL
ncbi:GH3 auxin-responsive promoter-domain-containing protein [Pisolithus tinctorius]|nr:GH3 auxin-responsive promoter-domain-containing protein [Pisolithus tinctorius]